MGNCGLTCSTDDRKVAGKVFGLAYLRRDNSTSTVYPCSATVIHAMQRSWRVARWVWRVAGVLKQKVECRTVRFKKNALFPQETAVSASLKLLGFQGLKVLIPRSNATKVH
jgi:hypothetical protein